MRILVVARSLPFHHVGGLESAAWDLARGFARTGASVTVLTTAAKNLPADSQVEGVRIRALDAPSGRYSPAWWSQSRAAFASEFADVDVVFGVSAAANGLIPLRDPARRQAFVFQAHGTSSGEIVSKLRSGSPKAYLGVVRHLYWALFKDAIYRRYDAVVAVGEAVDRQLRSWPTKLLLGSTPVALIRNGVDKATFAFTPEARAQTRERFGFGPETKLMLSIGRLHRQKGVQIAVEAVAALPDDPNLRLLIVGDGPEAAALSVQVAELGLGHRVLMAGPAKRADIPGLLCAADAFLFPTLRVEGLPITVLEALANGLDVVTTPSGAATDLPCDWVPFQDPAAVAAKIAAAFVLAPDAQRPSRLPDRYTLDHSVGAYLNLFQGLLIKGEPGAGAAR